MPNVSPKTLFWITFAVWAGTGITGGAVHLTHIVPPAYMDAVTEYVAFGVFLGTGFLTMVSGAGMTRQSQLVSTAALPGVHSIRMTSQTLADATPSDKVIGPNEPSPPPATKT